MSSSQQARILIRLALRGDSFSTTDVLTRRNEFLAGAREFIPIPTQNVIQSTSKDFNPLGVVG